MKCSAGGKIKGKTAFRVNRQNFPLVLKLFLFFSMVYMFPSYYGFIFNKCTYQKRTAISSMQINADIFRLTWVFIYSNISGSNLNILSSNLISWARFCQDKMIWGCVYKIREQEMTIGCAVCRGIQKTVLCALCSGIQNTIICSLCKGY